MSAEATQSAPKKNVTLFERADALRIIEEWVREHEDEILMNEGALPDELAQLLEEADGDFDTKMERVAIKRREFQGNGKKAKAEKDYYAQREKMWGNADNALRKYQHSTLELAGRDRVKTALATVWLQNSPPSCQHQYDNDALLEIAEASLVMPTVPADAASSLAKYVQVELVAKLDSKAILADWKARKQALEVEAESKVSLTPDEEEGIRLILGMEDSALPEGERVPDETFEANVSRVLLETTQEKRAAWVAEQLAAEFPGITVEQSRHVRQS